MNLRSGQESGFTVVELLVVIVIIAVLFGLSTINLGKASSSASLSSTTNKLLADLRNEQVLAMEGDMGSQTSQQPHGVYIQSNSYTLFASTNYNSSDTNNFSVSTSQVSLTTSFSGNQVVFEPGDGAVMNFSNTANTITLSDSGASETITINRFGATSVN